MVAPGEILAGLLFIAASSHSRFKGGEIGEALNPYEWERCGVRPWQVCWMSDIKRLVRRFHSSRYLLPFLFSTPHRFFCAQLPLFPGNRFIRQWLLRTPPAENESRSRSEAGEELVLFYGWRLTDLLRSPSVGRDV